MSPNRTKLSPCYSTTMSSLTWKARALRQQQRHRRSLVRRRRERQTRLRKLFEIYGKKRVMTFSELKETPQLRPIVRMGLKRTRQHQPRLELVPGVRNDGDKGAVPEVVNQRQKGRSGNQPVIQYQRNSNWRSDPYVGWSDWIEFIMYSDSITFAQYVL